MESLENDILKRKLSEKEYIEIKEFLEEFNKALDYEEDYIQPYILEKMLKNVDSIEDKEEKERLIILLEYVLKRVEEGGIDSVFKILRPLINTKEEYLHEKIIIDVENKKLEFTRESFSKEARELLLDVYYSRIPKIKKYLRLLKEPEFEKYCKEWIENIRKEKRKRNIMK